MTSAKFWDFFTPFSRNHPYSASLLHLLLGYPSPLPVQTSYVNAPIVIQPNETKTEIMKVNHSLMS